MAPFLATDAASPRITTYTDRGRMELSAATAANWAAKGGNLFAGELGTVPGDVVVVDCPTDWLPAALVLGCWQAGLAVCSPASPAAQDAAALVTVDADRAFATDFAGEVLLVSTDPFGRGVAESGGEVPFGVTDLAPELRVQGDRYAGLASGADAVLLVDTTGAQVTGTELQDRASARGENVRAVTAGWVDADSLVDRLLPLFAGGSVVLSTDASPERLAHLADVERGAVR